jgi:hypothetical protein
MNPDVPLREPGDAGDRALAPGEAQLAEPGLSWPVDEPAALAAEAVGEASVASYAGSLFPFVDQARQTAPRLGLILFGLHTQAGISCIRRLAFVEEAGLHNHVAHPAWTWSRRQSPGFPFFLPCPSVFQRSVVVK